MVKITCMHIKIPVKDVCPVRFFKLHLYHLLALICKNSLLALTAQTF